MNPVIPQARTGYRYLEVARNQPPYLPLHTIQSQTECRTEWQLSWRERVTLLFTGRLFLKFLTFGRPLYPIMCWCLDEDDPDQPLQGRTVIDLKRDPPDEKLS